MTGAFAAFPRGIDGLLMRDDANVRLLVQAGRPEERWARSFAPGRTLVYRLRTDTPLQALTTGEALAQSDIADVLRAHGVTSLFLHGSRTADIDVWARAQGIGVLAPSSRLARALEHKTKFDVFLAGQRVAKPRSVAGPANKLDPLPFLHGAVAQEPESMGGEGTFFLAPGAALATLVDAGKLRARAPCLVRELVPGEALGVTLLITDDSCALSALRVQAYFPAGKGAVLRQFAGVQWLPFSSLAPRLVKRVERVFARLARALHGAGYRGFANVDFIRTPDDDVRVIECNPRPSAATPCLYAWPELLHGLDAAALYMRAVRARARARTPRFRGLPRTDFAGSVLDIPASTRGEARRVKRTIASGVYQLARGGPRMLSPDPHALGARGTLFAFSSVRRGERYAADDTLVNIVSHDALYDLRGRLNARGRRVHAAFEVTR